MSAKGPDGKCFEEKVKRMEENKLKEIVTELEAPADFTSPEVLYDELVASIKRYHPSDDLSMIQ